MSTNQHHHARGGTQQCPECRGHVTWEGNEVACTNCGVVLEDAPIDTGPEWRAYTTKEARERARVGAPVDRASTGDDLLTEIRVERTDANGNVLSHRQRRATARLRKKQKWAREGSSTVDGAAQIRKITSALSMPDVVTADARFVFKQAAEAGLLRSYGIDLIAVAAVYAATNRQDVERPLAEMAASAGTDTQQVFAAYRLLSEQLDLQIEPPTGAAYIPLICDALDLPFEVERKAVALVRAYRNDNVGDGTFPSTLAAAAVYAVCRHGDECPHVTQQTVADAADRDNSTLSQAYREVRGYVGSSATS